ncbi:hypothetical protein U1Q18_025017 [Sarracenia purpurea var. burkii]
MVNIDCSTDPNCASPFAIIPTPIVGLIELHQATSVRTPMSMRQYRLQSEVAELRASTRNYRIFPFNTHQLDDKMPKRKVNSFMCRWVWRKRIWLFQQFPIIALAEKAALIWENPKEM